MHIIMRKFFIYNALYINYSCYIKYRRYINYRCYIMKEEVTTVQLNKSVVKALKRIKKYPRETYNEVILSLIKNAEETKEFDKFVQKAQKAKMRELWGKGDYTAWENA